ncbi:hypothetical protein AVEN_155080-1 [Araneus ventricosus]|uniref:Uncharacterized protein n=1 Tax=Araneus ventricosus TaxID=182803 RepID=A0A4Y2AA35_ARAVE|nr:hypothetical protein AVEN_155080-1 [Araneus ventricosus]
MRPSKCSVVLFNFCAKKVWRELKFVVKCKSCMGKRASNEALRSNGEPGFGVSKKYARPPSPSSEARNRCQNNFPLGSDGIALHPGSIALRLPSVRSVREGPKWSALHL